MEWGLPQKKNPTAGRVDAEWLLAHCLGLRRLDLFLAFDKPLAPPELQQYRNLLRQRAEGVPVAYLLEEAGFWNLDLHIGPGCLVPRPETELLVEKVVQAVEILQQAEPPILQEQRLQVLELGVGSGCIPLAVLSETQQVDWVGVDRSWDAMGYALANRQRHQETCLTQPQNQLHLVCGNGLAAINPQWQPHFLVSNPPYIPSDTIPTLQKEVSEVEPRLALDGGKDGLAFYRALAGYAVRSLAEGGQVLVEIGFDQGETVPQLFEAQGLHMKEVYKDLAGHPRVVWAEKTALPPTNGA